MRFPCGRWLQQVVQLIRYCTLHYVHARTLLLLLLLLQASLRTASQSAMTLRRDEALGGHCSATPGTSAQAALCTRFPDSVVGQR